MLQDTGLRVGQQLVCERHRGAHCPGHYCLQACSCSVVKWLGGFFNCFMS
ncbi:5-azacytidine induced gene 1 (predicted), isoform CRA_b, partial [Rattus norvegicus]